jgi:hypothetical protein
MNPSAMHQFQPGKAYLVAHRVTSDSGELRVTRKVRRIFKGMEKRFGEITCAVFTARVDKDASAFFNKKNGTMTISGKRVPQSEVSIPHYEIETAELV